MLRTLSIRFALGFALASTLCAAANTTAPRTHAVISRIGLAEGFAAARPVVPLRGADSSVGRLDTQVVHDRMVYPADELSAGRSGDAYGEILIDRSGYVTVIDVVGSKPPFARALRAALTGVEGNAALRPGPDNAAAYSVSARFTAVASNGNGQDAKFVGVMHVGVGGPNAVTILDSPERAGDSGLSAPTTAPAEAEEYPDPDSFMMVEAAATYDEADLMRRLQYPEIARRGGIEGTVVVHALVDRHGVVQQTRIVSSANKVLDEAAIAVVKGTPFDPARQANVPVATWVPVPVRFSLGH